MVLIVKLNQKMTRKSLKNSFFIFTFLSCCMVEKKVDKLYIKLRSSKEFEILNVTNFESPRKYYYGIEFFSDTIYFNGAFVGGFKEGILSLQYRYPDTLNCNNCYRPKSKIEENKILSIAKKIVTICHENKINWILREDSVLKIGISRGVIMIFKNNNAIENQTRKMTQLEPNVFFKKN